MSNNMYNDHQVRRTSWNPFRHGSERPERASDYLQAAERRPTREMNGYYHRPTHSDHGNREAVANKDSTESSTTKEKKTKGEPNESHGCSKNNSPSDSTVCAICYCQYSSSRIPKVMACGHTFCAFCIRKLGEGRHSTVVCPTCRKATLSNHKFVPTNFQLLELLEKFNMLSKVKEDNVPQSLRSRRTAFMLSDLSDSEVVEDDVSGTDSEFFEDLRRLSDQIDGLIDGIQHIRANLRPAERRSRAAELDRISRESRAIAEEFARGQRQIRSCYSRYRTTIDEYNELNASLGPYSEQPVGNQAQPGTSRWSGGDEEESLPRGIFRSPETPRLSPNRFPNRWRAGSTSSQSFEDWDENLVTHTPPPNLGFVVRNTSGQFRTANECTLCNCGVPSGQTNIDCHLNGRKHRALLEIMNRQYCLTLGLDLDEE